MQDLRDKLVKAGLANKKQARKARTELRKQHKEQAEQSPVDQQALQREERFREKQEQQRELAREHQQEQERRRAEHEAENRIRNVIRGKVLTYQPAKNQDRPFYFVGRDRRIRKLMVSFALAHQLTSGQVAIVETEIDPARDFVLIPLTAVQRLEELGATEIILFWCKPGDTPPGDLPAYGATR